ncbi:MAG: hypothetical protein UH678_05880 [Fibrobacteraceae bacterium]|nr:hypothetical protein [Fibrobacteraceae bacterium]
MPAVLAREPCHCEPQRGEAISLQATFVFGLLRYARNDKNQDGHTTFAMTIRTTHQSLWFVCLTITRIYH